jgi:small subunit ribosomal protein S4
MGDPKKLKKSYSKPNHPWQKLRIDEEKLLMKGYGFKNKQELWKVTSKLNTFKYRIKNLIPKKDAVSELEKKDLVSKLFRMNLVKDNAIPEDVLAITFKDICERRLQTILVRKNLARGIKQARQFIVHGHVMVGEKKMTSPSYIVTSAEEVAVRLADNSKLASLDHPERIPVQKEIKKELHEAGLKEEVEKEEEKAHKPKKKAKSLKQELKEDVKREEKELAKEDSGDEE